jgi:hypothetical protein
MIANITVRGFLDVPNGFPVNLKMEITFRAIKFCCTKISIKDNFFITEFLLFLLFQNLK